MVWIEQAEYDLLASKLSFENGFYEWSCYQCVQAVEKCLKAVLVSAKVRPPKIHKLGILLSMCNSVYPSFMEIKLNFRFVESYTFITRYPFILPSKEHKSPHDIIVRKDAESLLDISEQILINVKTFLFNYSFAQHQAELVDFTNQYFTEEEVEQRLKSIVSLLQNISDFEVVKVILFGSFAKNKVRPRTSTMDILVIVKNCNLGFVDRIVYVRDLTKGNIPIIEPIVYTQDEFKIMIEDEAEGFLESAIEEGIVLWEKNSDIK